MAVQLKDSVVGDYTHVAAGTATTVVRQGSGVLNAIIVNTKGATGNTLTVYDNTTNSGQVIAIIDTTVTPYVWTYNARFNTGLTVTSANGTGADYTVVCHA